MSPRLAAPRPGLLLLLAVLAPSPAAAQEPSPEARRAFEEGQIAYRLGHYSEAIRAFETAYRVSSARKLLFNIAQAYRMRFEVDGDLLSLRRAREIYRSYLREDPGSPQRADVERILTTIDRRLAEEPAQAAEAAARSAEEPAPAAPLRLDVRQEPSRGTAPHALHGDPMLPSRQRSGSGGGERGSTLGRWWFWMLAGVVVAGAATATAIVLMPGPEAPRSGLGTVDYP